MSEFRNFSVALYVALTVICLKYCHSIGKIDNHTQY